MARTRKKAATPETPIETSKPDVLDTPTAIQQPNRAPDLMQDLAERTRIEPEQPANGVYSEQHPGNGHTHHSHAETEQRRAEKQFATGHIANPSSRRRESHAEAARKLPGKLMVKAGDLSVRMIDAGDNRMGIGIKVELPEGRTLTSEEKDVIRKHVRGEEGEHTGFRWDHDNRMWHKAIVQNFEKAEDVPPSRPVAIRLDAESRVEKLADALRQLQGKAEGFVQAEEQRQERGNGHGGRE